MANADFRTAKGLHRLVEKQSVLHSGMGKNGTYALAESWSWYYYHLNVLNQVSNALRTGRARKKSGNPVGYKGAGDQPVLVHLVRTKNFLVNQRHKGGEELWFEVLRLLSKKPGLFEPFLLQIVSYILSMYPGDTFLIAYPVKIAGKDPEWRTWPWRRKVVVPDWSKLVPPRPKSQTSS